jgi:cytochrome c oxidase subunit II
MNLPHLPPPLTEQAEEIEGVWNVFLIGAVLVFLFVTVLVVVILIRFRRRTDRMPRQVRENIPFELTYTAVPLLIVLGLFVITFITVRSVDAESESDEPVDLVVDVTGFRWQWRFEYPESGVVVNGTPQEIPELVLPASTTIRFNLTSVDVIHSFWIPGFRYKRDMFPNEVGTIVVDMADRTGAWPAGGVCAEFCGLDHHKMFFDLRVVTPDEFAQWLADNEGDES